jgi:hypothetical protein
VPRPPRLDALTISARFLAYSDDLPALATNLSTGRFIAEIDLEQMSRDDGRPF